ncbi:response regulator [Flavitalea flava]
MPTTRKLNCILLVDDNDATNLLNKLVIDEMEITEKVAFMKDGPSALQYLGSHASGQEHGVEPIPELIFVDIGMPSMDGWEFLREYNKFSVKGLPENTAKKTVVVMLTGSINPEDAKKAKTFPSVTEFRLKPLSMDMLEEIMGLHFGD